MQHHNFNIINRRDFLSTAGKAGLAAALASVANVPGFLKRAMAEGTIGNGKKVLFIWLRFGNDSLNSVIPVGDSAYVDARPNIKIPFDGGTNYATTGACDVKDAGAASTYGNYPFAVRLGNGFAGLHPSLKFLAPVYNAGDLAIIHRVGYANQSRSHFDSQNYWENGNPNNDLSTDGIFYRTIIASGLAGNGVTGVTIQNSLPLIMRGPAVALTNLTDPLRYNLLSIPSPTGDPKADSSIAAGNSAAYAPKNNRDLLYNQYASLQQTLNAFAAINFTDAGNTFQDDMKTDGDANWVPVNSSGQSIGDSSKGYFLFPASTNSLNNGDTNNKNGGWRRSASSLDGNKYVVNPNHQSFFYNLKAAALVLNNTSTIIAGTELGGFDTHQTQVQAAYSVNNNQSVLGGHADLQRCIGWALYGLRKYFTLYGKGGPYGTVNSTVNWNDVVVVTLSEFGRTSRENADLGTDHAEAGAMFVAGGAVKGYNKGNPSGVFNCHSSDTIPWVPGLAGSMFGVSNSYLKRNTDYRSVLGEIIRKHLGATQNQLNTIIPGYATENLLTANTSAIDGTAIRGEVGIL